MSRKLKKICIRTGLLAVLVFFWLPALLPPKVVNAQEALKASDCPSGKLAADDPQLCARRDVDCPSGHVVKINKEPTSKCEALGNNCDAKGNTPSNTALNKCLNDNPIVKRLNQIVNVLAALVGVVVVGSIIVGGLQYAAAGESSDEISKAKQRIINSLFALIAFMLTYAFLQWLIPGGVFE